MKVNKVIETPEGIVTFDGELTAEEVDFVIEVGLNTLLKMGAFPLVKKEPLND